MLDGLQTVQPKKPAPVEQIEWKPVQLPPTKPISSVSPAGFHLRNRGIMRKFAQRWGIMQLASSSSKLLIPYYRGGIPVFYSVKILRDESTSRYWHMRGKKPLYYLHCKGRTGLVVVEGVFDALSVRQNTSLAAVALSGKTLARHLLQDMRTIIGEQPKIIIMLDGDAQADACKLQKELSLYCDPINLTPALGRDQDPNSISAERLREILE